jgi:hypothetical protein
MRGTLGRAGLVIVVAGALAGCGGGAPSGDATASPAAVAEDGLLAQARDALRRAETAPLPTPLPPPSPIPRGWKPLPAPDLKAEEIEAIHLLEQAAAAQPGKRAPQEMIARVYEPWALRQHERAVAARGIKKNPPPALPDQGVDVSPARVSRAYRAAVEADPATDLIDPMIAFAGKVDDLDSMEWAHQELFKRAKEKDTVTPQVRYGDFLRDRRKDVQAAAEQYRGALIWAPNDVEIRAKVAEIYLGLAKDHYGRREYAGAEVQLKEAAKFIGDPDSPQGKTLADYRQRLAAIRR